MKVRHARLGVLLLAVLGLLGSMIPLATATEVKLIVFTGQVTFDRGLGYPCTPNKPTCPPTVSPEVKTGPKNEPEVNIRTTGGTHAGYDFASANCVKVSASTPTKPTPKGGVDLCSITSTGVVWGWCGLFELMGVATLRHLTNAKTTIERQVKGTGVGSILYLRGGDKNTNIYAVVTVIPPPPTAVGGNCTNRTGFRFTLMGTAVYKDVT